MDACHKNARPFASAQSWGGYNMTSLAEAESKFGPVVRDAGGAIYGIETTPSVGGRQEEKLRTGTLDGFVKIAVSLNQPNIDAVSSITRNQTRVVIAIQ
jgi:hypothetical protein